MSAADAPEHGGDLAWAHARFPEFRGEWLDLSTGVSPYPWPAGRIDASTLRRLPQEADLLALCEAAAAAYGVPDADWVAAVPGAQAAIQTLALLRPRCRVAIASPTYGGHAAAWRAAGHEVVETARPLADCGAAVVVNPNNPDGRLLALDRLRAWRPRDGWLIVDESFADAMPEPCLRPLPPGVIALRSFGKFYGLPGLRLGFALAEPELAARLRRVLGPWPVSGPALAIGAAALSDASWRESTRRRLAAAAQRLDRILSSLGCELAGGTPLFRFARAPALLFERLAAVGVYVRCFPARPNMLRFGLPGPAEPRLAAFAALDAGRRRS